MAKEKTEVIEAEPPAAPAVVGIGADQFERMLERVGQANATAMRQSLRRENPNYNEVSVFTYPEGEMARPKPKLTREVLFCGQRAHEDQLTPAEIELFNRFDQSKTARNGTWEADILRRGKRELLVINLPVKGLDRLMELPNGLSLILLELLDGAAAADPISLIRRVEELEKKLAAQGVPA